MIYCARTLWDGATDKSREWKVVYLFDVVLMDGMLEE